MSAQEKRGPAILPVMPGLGKAIIQERRAGGKIINEVSLCGALRLLSTIYGVDLLKLQDRYGIASHCLECDEPYDGRTKNKYALKGYCSPECYHKSRQINVVCDQCGKLFPRQASLLIAKTNDPRHKDGRVFCNRYCLGSAQGRKYGFGGKAKEKAAKARSEHAQKKSQEASWVREWVWLEHFKTGLCPYRLSKRLNIPVGSIYKYFAERRTDENRSQVS